MRASILLTSMAFAAAVMGCGVSVAATAPDASGPTLTLQDHVFSPTEITIPANAATQLTIINKDPQAEEFDSSALKVEKVIAGGKTGTVRLRPLPPGRYPFSGEYHSSTAKGVVVVK